MLTMPDRAREHYLFNIIPHKMHSSSSPITSFVAPMISLLHLLGAIVGWIWLICLGMWSPIAVSIAILFLGALFLGYLLMPSAFLAIPAVRAAEKGNMVTSFSLFLIQTLYSTALMVAWAYVILKKFAGMGPDAAQWPLLLISFGAATGPWAFMVTKVQQANQGEDQHSATAVCFLAAGYILALVARLFASASFDTCLWILIISITPALIIQGIIAVARYRAVSR